MKKVFLVMFYVLLNLNILLAQHMYVASGNGVNLREGAGTNYKTTTTIPNGARVRVITKEGDWAKVEYDGKTGYVSAQYLSDNKPQTSSASSTSTKNTASRTSDTRSSNSNSNKKSSPSAYDGATPMPLWGLGLRLGDPTGLTVKRYLPGRNAVEFNLGATGYRGFDYRDDFYDRDRYRNYEYLGFYRKGAISFQAHYLWQKDIRSANGLQWYWGVGAQFRSKTYEYHYRYRNHYGPGQGDYTWIYSRDKITNIDFGTDVLIGLEYHIPNVPLSVFADFNLMLEFFDNPLSLLPQGGIGIRYRF